jgi:hypothetical protein
MSEESKQILRALIRGFKFIASLLEKVLAGQPV